MKTEPTANYNALYVHVPFCESKCPYCAFASAVMSDSGDAGRYISALRREMAARADGVPALGSLYIGGGTPSALPLREWDALLSIVGRYFKFLPGAEMTAEANPGSIEKSLAALWKDWGINRVSLGVQSLNEARLAFLGRVHGARQAEDAVALCLGAGFSVSLDMMFGLPGETLRDWMADLRAAIALKPHHISVYQLSVENGTPFADRNFILPEGYAQYRYAQWRLARAGFSQYEVASFARAGHESRHNLNYWAGGGYIGIGPAAWSFSDGVRSRNAAALGEYCGMTERGQAAVFSERMEGEAAAREAAVLALRTRDGISWASFAKKYGDAAEKIKAELRQFPSELVNNGDDSTSLTPKGFRVGNAIWREII